jgi:hypothetical protein
VAEHWFVGKQSHLSFAHTSGGLDPSNGLTEAVGSSRLPFYANIR